MTLSERWWRVTRRRIRETLAIRRAARGPVAAAEAQPAETTGRS